MKDKKCKKCGENKPVEEMVKMKTNKSGYGSTCKDCMKLASHKFREENPIQQMISCAKSSAKKRDIYFNLKKEDLVIPEFCPYTGLKLNFKVGDGVRMDSPSIDRIDNKKGYIKENIMIISYKANLCKSNMTIEELINFANNILLIHQKD